MPDIVRMLVLQGADVIRVAEVEHSLERAYLDLVARQDLLDAQAAAPMSSTVAPGGVRTGGAGQ